MAAVVVFGSAAEETQGGLPGGRCPHDVDVAYSLDPGSDLTREEVEQLAHKWAEKHGLGELPIDLREFQVDRDNEGRPCFKVPVPAGARMFTEVISENVVCQPQYFDGWTSLIRVSGDRPEVCAELLLGLAKRRDFEISLAEGDDEDWEAYVDALIRPAAPIFIFCQKNFAQIKPAVFEK